jgi:hypothetical protein
LEKQKELERQLAEQQELLKKLQQQQQIQQMQPQQQSFPRGQHPSSQQFMQYPGMVNNHPSKPAGIDFMSYPPSNQSNYQSNYQSNFQPERMNSNPNNYLE